MLPDPHFWAESRVRVPTETPTASLSVSPPAHCQSWTLLCSLLSMGVGVATVTQGLGPAAGLASDRTAALPPALPRSGPAGFSPPKSSCPAPPTLTMLPQAAVPMQSVPRGHGASGQSPAVPSAEGCCSCANRQPWFGCNCLISISPRRCVLR